MFKDTKAFSGFSVDDIDAARHGGPLIAWLADPAGNILSVLQQD